MPGLCRTCKFMDFEELLSWEDEGTTAEEVTEVSNSACVAPWPEMPWAREIELSRMEEFIRNQGNDYVADDLKIDDVTACSGYQRRISV